MVASNNPVKIKATKEAFQLFFQSIVIESSEIILPTTNNLQPIGEEDTRKHSRLRTLQAKKLHPGYDYYVGIEGGIVKLNSGETRIVVYSSVSKSENIETIRGCEIPLPADWYILLNKDEFKELGDIAAQVSGVKNIKQKQGAVGYFTKNQVTRFDILKQSVTMALVPFLNNKLFNLNS
jgi:inosine/xanthosine triphosphatase